MHTEALAAFRDNYIWLIRPDANDPRTLVVDPGDAAPVIGALERGGLELRGILVTHHHSDHVGGIRELLQWWQTKHPADGPPVWQFKFVIPIAGTLLLLQGATEIARCVICLRTGSWPSRLKDVSEIDVIGDQLADSEFVDEETKRNAIDHAKTIDETARKRGMSGDLLK